MRNKVIAAVIVFGLLATGGWWFTTQRAKSASAQNQTQYIQTPVRRGDIRSTISGTGPVTSVNGVLVRSNQTGTVQQILAQDGDRVKAGQTVLVLDNDNLEASYRQAQVDVTTNQSGLDNLLNPQPTAVRAQELKAESARLTLKQRQQDVANLTVLAARAGVIASVKVTEGSDIAANALLFTIFDDLTPSMTAAVPQASAALIKVGQRVSVELAGFGSVGGTVVQNGASAAPGTGNRDASVPVSIALAPTPGIRSGMVGQVVFEGGGLPYAIYANGSVDNDAVEVRTQVSGAVDRMGVREGDRVKVGDLLLSLSNESLLLQLKQAENDLKTQEQNLVNLVEPAKDPSGQLRTLRNKLDQSLITLGTRQADFEDLTVKAPVAGQISALTLKVGDRVTANQQLFRVADYGAMQVTIAVDELDIAKARVGQRAQIALDALPGRTYQGKVYKINPEGIFRNDIATFEVTVLIDEPRGLMAGMNATVNIVVEEKTGVLYLPAQAVQVQRGQARVQVLENGAPVQKDVQVGLRTSSQVEITSGLKENDQVILTIIRPQQTSGLGGLFGGNRQQQTQTTFPQEQQQQVRPGQGQQRTPTQGQNQGGTGR